MKYTFSLVLVVFSLILFGGGLLFSEHNELSSEEGRRMATFDIVLNPETDPNSVLYNKNKSITERIEDVFKDQFPLRNKVMEYNLKINTVSAQIYDYFWWTKFYLFENPEADNEFDAKDENPLLSPLSKQNYSLSKLGDYYRLNGTDWLIDPVESKPIQQSEKDAVSKSMSSLDRIQRNFPELKIYGFFVNQGNNLPWYESYLGARSIDRMEFIAQSAPETIKFSQMYYNDLSDYQSLHYKSDHHWNNLGSERGYRLIYDMMQSDINLSPILEKTKEWDFSGLYGVKYRGSRSSKLRSLYNGYDNFTVNEYDLGNRETYVISPQDLSRAIPARFTLMDEYKSGFINNDKYYDHYIKFYGTATGHTPSASGAYQIYKDSEYIFMIDNPDNNTF